ncbi:hypothetical protein EOL70_11340 [Leucothrix sargassi]|nr:hypothetical protein EOL70_11340 [Leucothrix sargassi]
MKTTFEPKDWATCPSCGSARNRGDSCDYCGRVYRDVIHQKQNPAKTFLKSLSSKYQVERQGDELRISWRWGGMKSAGLLIFFVIWNSIIFSQDYGFNDDISYWEAFMSIFPIPAVHMILGIVGPIYVLVRMINSTTIKANSQTLSVSHHPIPWGKRYRFQSAEIEQLFVSEAQRSSKKKSWTVPELQLFTKSGVRHRLLKGNKTVDFSDYEMLRDQLSNALDIELVSVQGEVNYHI